jgi:hypothetical protein
MQARGLLLSFLLGVLACASSTPALAAEAGPRLPQEVVDQVTASDNPVPLARALGMMSLMGRPLDVGRFERTSRHGTRASIARDGSPGAGAPRCRRRPPKLQDVPIANDPDLTANAPSVAANPRRKKLLAAAYVGFPFPGATETQCVVKRSFDRGRTWSEGTLLPVRETAVSCGGPVLAYSPDGRRLFAAYQDFRSEGTEREPLPGGGYTYRSEGDSDIVVSVSTDHGRTWSTPSVALDGDPWGATFTCDVDGPGCTTSDVDPGSNYSRASIALDPWARRHERVYVTGTRGAQFDPDTPRFAIAFTRSSDCGWLPPTVVDFTTEPSSLEVVQGGQVAAGPEGQVLVAWYHPSDDGRLSGRFEIRSRHSGDGGETWGPIVKAAIDEDETSFWLGSSPRLKWWWTTMFPRLAIDRGGRAHIVYTHDPEAGNDTGENGDVRYISSAGAPYAEWSAPVTVNDDPGGATQGRASVAVRHRGRSSIVDVIWEDTRLSAANTANPEATGLYYDVFRSWRPPGRRARWTPNRRVSDTSSLQSDQFIESGTSLASSGALIYGAWVDRRDKTTLQGLGENIFGSRLLGGRGR